jgi:hypothetical protein
MDTSKSSTSNSTGSSGSSILAGDGHQHRRSAAEMSHIPGWGADLDRKNRPAVPMERTPPRLPGVRLDQPEQQHQHIEVFVSPERPGITPLFGTSTPPSGISGAIRRFAYKLTENDIRHWLLLMFADRVNVVEGVAQDLSHGKLPNVLAEMGIKSEWQHNRAGLVRKAAIVTAVAGVAWYLLARRSERGHASRH